VAGQLVGDRPPVALGEDVRVVLGLFVGQIDPQVGDALGLGHRGEFDLHPVPGVTPGTD
jgi:hypothetical protein